MKKKEGKLLKRMEVLEAPKREEARLAAEAEAAANRPDMKIAMKGGKGKRMTAKERAAETERLRIEEEERKVREEEEARIRAEEEERKRKEEEEKKAAAAAAAKKGGKPKKGAAAEEEAEPVEETEEMKVEREKNEINAELETLRSTIKAFEDKSALCETQKASTLEQADVPKQIELNERDGTRKHMRGSLDLMATEKLGERKAYVLCHVKKNAEDEDYTENIVVDGACMRTPEEDIKWAEEQAELEAAAAKGSKKAPPAKKK